MNKKIPRPDVPLVDPLTGAINSIWFLYWAGLANESGTGGVQSVTGLNTDNTDPTNPIVQLSVDGVTITGDGTPGNPLIAHASGGSVAWGDITGTLSDQTDLQAALGLKANISSLAAVAFNGDYNSLTVKAAADGVTITGNGTSGSPFVATGSGFVPTSRTISTVAPLSGGGDLSANRTLTTSMATARLIGRTTAGTGVMEEISVGAGLSLSALSLASTITQYTDEMAQDAVGAMVDSTLVYTDATPLLSRAALTGDVTASAGSNAMTIPNDTVIYAKMQNVSAASRLIGRGSASGSGDPEEISLGSGLSMSGTTLSASAAAPVVSSVAYSASLSLDWSGNDEIRVGALTGNIDITGMTNMVDGKRYVLRLVQDATGGRTVTFSASNIRFSEDIPSVWYSTTASKASLFGFLYNSTDSKADVVAQVAGY